MEKFQISVEKGKAGLWYVTSPDIKGLLVVGETRREALATAGTALDDLEALSLSSQDGKGAAW